MAACRIAFGSIDRELVFVVLGQTSVAAALLAIDGQVAVQEVGYKQLRSLPRGSCVPGSVWFPCDARESGLGFRFQTIKSACNAQQQSASFRRPLC